MFAVESYPDLFVKAAALSPHWRSAFELVLNVAQRRLDLDAIAHSQRPAAVSD